MRIPRVYHPGLARGAVELSASEAQHVRAVLRRRVGDQVELFDGEGRSGVGRISAIDRKDVRIEVGAVRKSGSLASTKLTLAVAAPKGARQSVLVEKCTELGVWGIWPINYERSVVTPSANMIEKWRRTAIEACKQCGRNRIPEIREGLGFDEGVAESEKLSQVIVAQYDTEFSAMSDLIRPDRDSGETVVWIGPEGGMTDGEMERLLGIGAVGARLGEYVLRVETAAMAVAAFFTANYCGGR
jgi:16S rRNA (uracil1498-N3)-methyltransferase